MPKRIVGISAKLLDCAKEEFLEKGFQDASIRTIAHKAETSPRAIYTRFPDKEGLFCAIVEPAASELLNFFTQSVNDYWHSSVDNDNVYQSFSSSAQIYVKMINYIYDHLEIFKLILKCSEGTRYADYIEQLTIVNCNHLEQYHTKSAINPYDNATQKLLHVLTHSFYSGLFEPVLHDMSHEEALYYVDKLTVFFISGIENFLQNETLG